MLKLHIPIGIVAIVSLASCQQTPSTISTTDSTTSKAISYLRSQLKLSANVAVIAESQKPQLSNSSDLCQTSAPTQDGWAIALISEDTRYLLQTNQDASQIEICRSEDAKPETTGKYTGAGYTLRYPADWKAIDLGLEPSGASTVIFTPSRDNEATLQKLQQSQQVYAIVSKQPVSKQPIDSVQDTKNNLKNNLKDNPQNLVTIPFDAKVKGAKSGSKQEFTTAIANSTGNPTIWKVKALTLETDKFIYTVRYYQPDSKSDSNTSTAKAFEQFANSFALIQLKEEL